MDLQGRYKLRVERVPVLTNLEVKLKTRTTKEEALKEVERLCNDKKLLAGYEWKIEGCFNGGIQEFGEDLQDAIIEQIEEDPEESVSWDGMNVGYELNIFHVPVMTHLEVRLKTETTREDAIKEVEQMVGSKKLFEGYDWKIEGCADGGINELGDALQDAILERIGRNQALVDCIEENPG